MNEVPILLKVVLFSNCTFTGKIATKEMKDGKLYYRLSVKTCNLNFYKLVEEMNHTHRIKLPYVYKSDEVG
ncbi:hypothetical protein JCM9140_4429 [Halalkalibacter wakoensis JCM 9140]|uniref:Uncharacterized protein n=2 Tax=Halalkalibacter wakoensis TaxID=127891 RepID=W4Q9Z7_9BACI|nr:hypothetical protein JCM9140_4429 [Halalkalibacter wakoensis JCM 9140]